MSVELGRALHDAVDPGPQDAPFETAGLVRRVRRRRAVRRGVRATVAVGAAGAIVLGAGHLAGGPSGLPAARPDAAPGTCGSDVARLGPAGGSDELGVVYRRGTDREVGWTSEQLRDAGATLGSFSGRRLAVQTVSPIADESLQSLDGPDVTALRVQAAQVAVDAADDPVLEVEAERLSATVARLDALRGGATPTPAPAPASEPDVRLLVTHAGTVVSTAGLDRIMSGPLLTHGTGTLTTFAADLTSCAPGGGDLPPGAYDAWLTVPGKDAGRTLVGPLALDLLAPDAPVSGLPDGFPAEVPLVAGTLVNAGRLDGGGWTAEVAVPGDDRLTGAASALGLDPDEAATYQTSMDGLSDSSSFFVSDVGRWQVTVHDLPGTAPEPTVLYLITPVATG
ncbi:hypothetical protein [Cellulomonas sp. URHB0016]